MADYPANSFGVIFNKEIITSILWTIVIGFIAGVIAKFIMPGDNEALGWYRPGEGAGLIGAVVGAIIVLFVYGLLAGRRRQSL
jgi:uncharacterized membrane protein YeaQ/YmgE (transglycosylase-associated protein family)